MDEKLELYSKLSHDLAKKHLIERLAFEIEVNQKLFDNDNISLEKLINDCRNLESFSQEEYEEALNQSQELLKETSYIS